MANNAGSATCSKLSITIVGALLVGTATWCLVFFVVWSGSRHRIAHHRCRKQARMAGPILLFAALSITPNWGFRFTGRDELKTAVQMFTSTEQANRDEAIETYGAIGSWDTSSITDMSNLFNGYLNFNEDIANWDVGHR